jgi:tetratricopeptide (TPR) repeat protein
MIPGQSLLKVLVIGDSEDIKGWLKQFVARDGLMWRLRFSCNLRVNSPDNQVGQQDLIIVLWDRLPPVTFSEVLSRASIDSRSVEGVIRELGIGVAGSEGARLRRTVVIGRGLTREDAIFLAEGQVGAVFSLPEKRIAWDRQIPNIVRRIEALHIAEVARKNSSEERVVGRFLEMLSVWDRVSDELQMKATDQLLRVLGDSSRYCELLARKCIAERNFRGAEQWLRKAISKNPNYINAMQLLADVFFELGKPSKSLELLEKLRESNPRNVQRMVKIAKCYVAMNEHQKADKVLCDAICIDEFYEEAREELGRVKVILGDYDSARILLRHTTKSRDLANFVNKLGIDLVARSKFQESIEHYKKAQLVLPGNEQSHLLFFNIGLAYAKWGRFSQARQYVGLALIRHPEYAKASDLLEKLDSRVSA